MVLIREAEGKWSCGVTAVKVPLREGAKVRVDGAALGRAEDVICRLERWEYHVIPHAGSRVMQLELTVAEEKKPGFIATELNALYLKLSPDDQTMVTAVLALVMLATVGGLAAYFYSKPFHGLAFVGRYIRIPVSVLILFFFSFVLPKKMKVLKRPQSFRENSIFQMSLIAGYFLLGVWLFFSARPAGFGWSDKDCADYLRGMGATLSHSYWPLVVAALPWISIGFKVFGMEFAEKTSEKLESVAKKGKE